MSECKYLLDILDELRVNAKKINNEDLEKLVDQMLNSNRVFISGAGRSGFVARALSNRLMHLGMAVYFVGEPTTPSIKEGDLLLVCSGSGETESLVVMAKKAISFNAKVATITIHPEASIGKMASTVIAIPGATPKSSLEDTCLTVQPMGNAFEQMLWLVCDVLVVYLMNKTKKTEEEMFSRHANLE